MLYNAASKSMIQVVAPGATISDDELAALAKLAGKQHEQGPVELVAVVFVGGRAAAEKHLPSIKRFGLQCRCLDGDTGGETVIYEGSRVKIGADTSDVGTLLPILREASWPHLATAVHRRLITGAVDDGPWVTFGWNSETTVTRFAPKDLGGHTIADVEAEAVANLERQSFTPQVMKPRVVALPGEYCSEAILVPDVMQAVARAVGAELLCVAIPKESRLMAVPADDFPLVNEVMRWSREMFDGAAGRRISPLPILVRDGKVVGFASPDTSAPAASKSRPWYKFW